VGLAFESVIGLEVHAQLLTASKLFCACSTAFGAEPNSQVCHVCLGLPGSLPVPNRRAIEHAMRAALALGCKVRGHSLFARKNYFYPDLAKGYQISQYELPLNEHGELAIELDGTRRAVRIVRIHVEEDAAKNLHGTASRNRTLVDFNRAGVPLMEIVSEPDLRSSAEAEEYLKRLREVLMFTGSNDGNLEEGSFRCDANVSIRPAGATELGTRVELKNINSFRFVRKAIDYEIGRQQALVLGGGKVVQETRTWSDAQGKTLPMRSKEEAMDYRYFPDPDLPPLEIDGEQVRALRSGLPELPAAKRHRWQRELGLTANDAAVLSAHPEIAAFFEATTEALLTAYPDDVPADKRSGGKRVANFIQSDVLGHVTTAGLRAEFPVRSKDLGQLLWYAATDQISGKQAKEILAIMRTQNDLSLQSIITSKGILQVSDREWIEEKVRAVLEQHPGNVAAYRSGKHNVLGWFVGQVMKATGGRANPALVNEVLRSLLDGPVS
jgi:aspartyl-tRNA(Asn)/glutamyl-tRNA(Gln) amidotransferase subunit B